MAFKLPCLTLKWKRTISVFVAVVMLLLLANVSYQLLSGKNNIITSFNGGKILLLPLNTYLYNVKPNSRNYYQGTYNLYDYKTKAIKKNVFNKLSKDLRHIIDKSLPPEEMKLPETCSEETIGNSCEKGDCLQLQLPKDPQIRLEQLIRPKTLHPDAKYLKVMHDMGNAIPGYYDIILITGASADHYLESKKHLYNIHANVLPHLRNFTIIYYNLGLTDEQKEDISSMCRCHMLDFPFDKFPKFVSTLKCYTWKPIVINAHASHCNVIHWMDASIRNFDNNSHLLRELHRRVRVHGFVGPESPSHYTSHMTLRETFHFFGDEACVYLQFKDAGTGFIMFLNKPLIKWGILEPWTACALNESCMCVVNPRVAVRGCKIKKGPYDYGRCHRFDQSVLGIIVRKLFREKSKHFFLQNYHDFFEAKRADKWNESISQYSNKKLSQ